MAGEPNLVGTWAGKHNVAMLDQYGKGVVNLVVTSQQGELFQGVMSWKATDGSKTGGSEKIAGVIDYDNKTVAIVQSKGGGVIWAYLKGGNSMHLVFTQASESAGSKTLAYRTTLTRVKK